MSKINRDTLLTPNPDLEARIVTLIKRENNSTRAREAAMAALGAQALMNHGIAPVPETIMTYFKTNRKALEAQLDQLLQVN